MSAAEIGLGDVAGRGESMAAFAARFAGALSIAALQSGWRGAKIISFGFSDVPARMWAVIAPGERPLNADDCRDAWRAAQGRQG